MAKTFDLSSVIYSSLMRLQGSTHSLEHMKYLVWRLLLQLRPNK